ncbi:MAG: Crp/Fnr family transcriptional regulator [Nitrospiria bacterium]
MEEKSKIWYLQKINLFKEMTSEEIGELDRATRMESVRKKTPIFFPGDPSQQVYLLKEGRVKISRISEEGREVTIALLEPGQIFGELEVLGDSPRDTLAEALDDSKICVVSKDIFLSMIRRKPAISFRLTKLIGFRMQKIESRVEDLVFRDVPARLAHLLLDLARDYGRDTTHGVCLQIKITHQEIANLIGSIRETVSAVLGDFKRDGWISFEGRQMTLLRPDLLQKRSESSFSGPAN